MSVAEWLDDGFLHPATALDREFVDVDGFVRLPVEGLSDVVQFAHVRVDGESVIVLGPARRELRLGAENAVRARYRIDDCVFIVSATTGRALVDGDELTVARAAAVAVTQYRCAWDESREIEVRGGSRGYFVQVGYSNDRYDLVARESV